MDPDRSKNTKNPTQDMDVPMNRRLSGSGQSGRHQHSKPRAKVVEKPKPLTRIAEDKSKHFCSEFMAPPDGQGSKGRRQSLTRQLSFGDTKPPSQRGSFQDERYLTHGANHKDLFDIATVSSLGDGTWLSKKEAFGRVAPNPRPVERAQGYQKQDSYKRESYNKEDNQETNEPHPLLEYPPLYYICKCFPMMLNWTEAIYRVRWSVSYPLQRRICGSQILRKLGIMMTWGELLVVLPLFAMIIGGILWTFFFPDVFLTGQVARLALILALGTGVHNSLITLLIGLPFERALWYHKLSGRIAFVNGILHTYVAHTQHVDQLLQHIHEFLFFDTVNASGTMLALLITGVVVTSLPYVRRVCFELFYYVHVVFVAIMAVCAFYHSGILIPILAGIIWGSDLLFRKVIMVLRHPRTASIRVISDTVVELSFPKTRGFDYNAGQHLSVAVPDISIFEWHPFSIATCPREKVVTVLIRVAGNWTKALHNLAKEKSEVTVLVEGPNGSNAVNILSPDRYKSVLLVSGGIGVTPIQSLSNQLIYEHSKGLRDLKRIRVLWSERDPVLMNDVNVVRRNSQHFASAPLTTEDFEDLQSVISGGYFDGASYTGTSMASKLLAVLPPGRRTDDELEEDYPFLEESDDDDEIQPFESTKPGDIESVADDSTFHHAFSKPNPILDMQVYLTSKDSKKYQAAATLPPFVHFGRPDIRKIFRETRAEAMENGLSRVAVFVCAPARLAQVCQNACVYYSNHEFQFDFHMEYQD